jgi:cob(I)alamin adenosyltransferase
VKVYTRKGDDGKTSLLSGTRIPKHNKRIEAYGTIDELNSFVGMLCVKSTIHLDFLHNIQNRLFDIGSYLAADGKEEKYGLYGVKSEEISLLENSMDEMSAELPELKNFILPGSCEANAWAHLCRTVCRRAERRLTRLAEIETVKPEVIRYLNRLSDWFFVYARYLSHKFGVSDKHWTKG